MALIEQLKRLDSLSPPPKPPLPDGLDPIAAFMTSLPVDPADVENLPDNPRIYESLDSVLAGGNGDQMQTSFIDGLEVDVTQ